MSMQGIIRIRTFTPGAKRRVGKIDFGAEFHLPGVRESGNELNYYGYPSYRFDAPQIIRRLSGALKGEGRAWATYILEDDFDIAYTYYDLGDGIKAVAFCSHDIYFDIDYPEIRYAMACRLGPDDLKGVLEEETEEKKVPACSSDEELRFEVSRYISPELIKQEEEYFSSRPYLKKLRDAVQYNFDNIHFGCGDFEPNPGWEEKGIAVFTKKEREYLSSIF